MGAVSSSQNSGYDKKTNNKNKDRADKPQLILYIACQAPGKDRKQILTWKIWKKQDMII